MTAGFRIGDTTYEMESVRRVTLRDSILFNAEARRADLGITWAGLLDQVDQVSAIPVAERVAHEGTWLLMAAVIWVLTENGVEEQGTHRELLAKNGLYAHLYSMYTEDF